MALASAPPCTRPFRLGPCPHPVWRTGREYCILHDPAPNKPPGQFNTALDNRVRAQEQDPAARAVDLSYGNALADIFLLGLTLVALRRPFHR